MIDVGNKWDDRRMRTVKILDYGKILKDHPVRRLILRKLGVLVKDTLLWFPVRQKDTRERDRVVVDVCDYIDRDRKSFHYDEFHNGDDPVDDTVEVWADSCFIYREGHCPCGVYDVCPLMRERKYDEFEKQAYALYYIYGGKR